MRNKLIMFLLIIFCCLIGCKSKKQITAEYNTESDIQNEISEDESKEESAVEQPQKKERITTNPGNFTHADIFAENVDTEYDGDLYFFDLNINDSIETVREKLTKLGYEFEEGYDSYLKIHKIWNKEMIREERINMDFMISFYKNKLYSFSKWSLSLEEAQEICDYYGGDFDIALLKMPQYYKIQKSNWIVVIGNNGDMNVLSIYDDVAADEVAEIYKTLE